jgi:hypothetical protein
MSSCESACGIIQLIASVCFSIKLELSRDFQQFFAQLAAQISFESKRFVIQSSPIYANKSKFLIKEFGKHGKV